MKKQLQSNSNTKQRNRIMTILLTFGFMLISMMGLTQTAYITNGGDSSISVINIATNTITAKIAVGADPYGVAVTSDGSKVFVVNRHANTVSVINTATNTVSATITGFSNPYGIAISPNGSKAYVSNWNDSTVKVINTSSNAISASIKVGDYPQGIAVSPDGSKVYVAVDDADNAITVINTVSNIISAVITVGTGPLGLSISPDGSKVYVTNYYDGTVNIINSANNNVLATITVGNNPFGIGVSPDGSKVYVTNLYDNSVNVINPLTKTVVATITVGSYPTGVSVSLDGTKIYVANDGDSTVSVINSASNHVSSTIVVGKNPMAFGNFISTYPVIKTCGANFTIEADTAQLHHYLVINNSYGKGTVKYDWSWGDGSHDTVPYPTHTYADSGFYNICLSITDSTGCQSTYCDSSFHAMRTTNTMVYMTVFNPLTTGTNEMNSQTLEVTVYPNPANDKLYIKSNALMKNGMLSIYNILGELMYAQAINSKQETINCKPFPSDIYFLQMKTESGSVVKRFVKE